MLSNEQVAEFQKLYRRRFGKEIGFKEAYESGIKLIRLVKLIYKPMTEEEHQKLQERRKQIKNENYYEKNNKRRNKF